MKMNSNSQQRQQQSASGSQGRLSRSNATASNNSNRPTFINDFQQDHTPAQPSRLRVVNFTDDEPQPSKRPRTEAQVPSHSIFGGPAQQSSSSSSGRRAGGGADVVFSSKSFWERATAVQNKALDLIEEGRFKGKLREFQRAVDQHPEDAQKAKAIHIFNSMCAYHKSGIALRFPRHHPWCEYRFYDEFVWTEEDVEAFQATGKLPIDFTSFSEDPIGDMGLWVIDASPDAPCELEMDPIPDFDQFPAVCLFDLGVPGQVKMVPSECIEIVYKGGNKVQFVIREEYEDLLRAGRDGGRWEGILDISDIAVAQGL